MNPTKYNGLFSLLSPQVHWDFPCGPSVIPRRKDSESDQEGEVKTRAETGVMWPHPEAGGWPRKAARDRADSPPWGLQEEPAQPARWLSPITLTLDF